MPSSKARKQGSQSRLTPTLAAVGQNQTAQVNIGASPAIGRTRADPIDVNNLPERPGPPRKAEPPSHVYPSTILAGRFDGLLQDVHSVVAEADAFADRIARLLDSEGLSSASTAAPSPSPSPALNAEPVLPIVALPASTPKSSNDVSEPSFTPHLLPVFSDTQTVAPASVHVTGNDTSSPTTHPSALESTAATVLLDRLQAEGPAIESDSIVHSHTPSQLPSLIESQSAAPYSITKVQSANVDRLAFGVSLDDSFDIESIPDPSVNPNFEFPFFPPEGGPIFSGSASAGSFAWQNPTGSAAKEVDPVDIKPPPAISRVPTVERSFRPRPWLMGYTAPAPFARQTAPDTVAVELLRRPPTPKWDPMQYHPMVDPNPPALPSSFTFTFPMPSISEPIAHPWLPPPGPRLRPSTPVEYVGPQEFPGLMAYQHKFLYQHDAKESMWQPTRHARTYMNLFRSEVKVTVPSNALDADSCLRFLEDNEIITESRQPSWMALVDVLPRPPVSVSEYEPPKLPRDYRIPHDALRIVPFADSLVLCNPVIGARLAAHRLAKTHPATDVARVRVSTKTQKLVAQREFARGALVLGEPPAVVAPQRMSPLAMFSFHSVLDDFENGKHPGVKGLDTFADADTPSRLHVLRRVALPVLLPEPCRAVPLLAVFRRIGHASHVCRDANCVFEWNRATFRGVLRAQRKILRDEVISISFMADDLPSEIRSGEILRRFGVECGCSRCEPPTPPVKSAGSDDE
ncbi:hypothetical protein EXIGLDRAFT_767674 [Exidia glandulosa HHB12029]|uniref:SET domain-containing protein n=1 Tax=Exidia glandulosa HHB12029 TaxID=1314781 RepID=A0A165IS83_EXIGL|nr:hypothetical protein EXIGLDRAFT_767674 [Exidia glandulosa HHB12029]